MKFRGGEFSTGTTGNFQPELTKMRVEWQEKQAERRWRDVSRTRKKQGRQAPGAKPATGAPSNYRSTIPNRFDRRIFGSPYVLRTRQGQEAVVRLPTRAATKQFHLSNLGSPP